MKTCMLGAPSGASFRFATAARPRSRASRASAIARPPKRCAARSIEVDRSALPPLEEGEYYHADLIGLAGRRSRRAIACRDRRRGRELRCRRPARDRTRGRQDARSFRSATASPTLKDGRIVLDPRVPRLAAASCQLFEPVAPTRLLRARSLRMVVAATPPSPIAWLIWSRPMTTSPAA